MKSRARIIDFNEYRDRNRAKLVSTIEDIWNVFTYYGDHIEDCEWMREDEDGEEIECACGFAQILRMDP